jgi:CheY-like chemotaxis protein
MTQDEVAMSPYALMIVDDNEVDRYALKRLLKKGGVDAPIFEKSDGLAAMEFLESYERNRTEHGDIYPPIIVFLDINMPRMNGFQFLDGFTSLREVQGGLENVTILMVSSSDNPSDRSRADAYGCVKGYINKMPKSGEDLRATIHPFLPEC